MKALFGCVVVSALIAGCASQDVDVEDSTSPVTLGEVAAECPPNSGLSYDNFGREFMERYPDVDIIHVIFETAGPSDYARDVSDAEIAMLGEWVACGAP